MAAPNSAASKKAAKAGAKKIPIAKPATKKTAKKIVLKAPATSAKASRAASLKTLKSSPTVKNLKSPTLKTKKTPTMKALRTPAVKSKKKPAVAKKAAPLRKVGDKAIKKTTGKKAKQMMIKGGLGGIKNNLEGGAKASAGGVAAFDLEAFVKVKFSELEKTAHQKKNVSGQTNSTVAELSKFNMKTANEHYKVKKEDSLEAILLALHLTGDEEKLDLSPRVAAAYKEVSDYQDLLLLGDLATITQEKRPYSWISGAPTLSPEAQTALTSSLLGLTLKLTGAKLANFKLKLPGGKMRAKSRPEVVAYLALIQNIVDAMAGSKNWKQAAKDSKLDKMHADITKIITDF